MRYNTIGEAKKAYKAAYAWGLKVQKACLLKKAYVILNAGYCDSNYREEDIDAWYISVSIWDWEEQKHISAEWVAYGRGGDEKFEAQKKEVISYLESKGITIK